MFLAASAEPSPVITAEIKGKTCTPGDISSARIRIESIVPIRPANNGEDEIKRPNILMVGGVEIPPPSGRDVMLVLMMSIDVVMREVGDGRHVFNDSGDA